jgi:beta-barrel assembly-enhancing protease
VQPLKRPLIIPLKRLAAVLLAASLAAPPAGAQSALPDLGDAADATLSESQERSIGKRVMMMIRSDRSYVEDAELSDYIAGLGRKLMLASDAQRGDLEFFMIQEDPINAFAMVGGYIGVNTGTVLASQSESELAGVVSHEIAHILQRHQARLMASQKGAALASLAGLAVAILAARSGNSQAPEAAIATAAGLQIQSQLDYTREYEREADRLGFTILERAGFDVRGMAAFFERMQRANRHNDGKAPGYLRTHPLTTERIADMQNRIVLLPARSVPDSLDYQMAHAKLRAQQGTPTEAVEYFRAVIAEKTIRRTRADAYGLVQALRRNRDFTQAEKELASIRGAGGTNPWIERLAAEIKSDQKKYNEALDIYANGLKVFPNNRSLFYGHTETLLNAGQTDTALTVLKDKLLRTPDDPRLYDLQARAYAAKNKNLAQHRSLAEAYYRRGNLIGAVEQLELAVKANDGDFYEKSGAEARMRAFKAEELEMRKEKEKTDKKER